MENLTFEEKIKALKAMHRNSHPDALNQLLEWEKRFIILKATEEWQSHPITKELTALAKAELVRIGVVLATKEDLTDIERKRLFALRDAHMVYLALLAVDAQSEMKTIEQSINYEINPNE